MHIKPPPDGGFLAALTIYGLFRAAVPTLSVISGYFFFRNFDYVSLIAKKSRTILVPALMWSAVSVVPMAALQWTGLLEPKAFDLTSAYGLIDGIIGIEYGPVNLPLYFLFDIFFCALISPLLYLSITRATWVGALVLLVIWFLRLDVYTTIRGDIMFGFYIGGVLTVRGVNLSIPLWSRFVSIATFLCGGILLALYAQHIPVSIIENDARTYIDLLRLTSPLAMWSFSSFVVGTIAGDIISRLGSLAFFIYCSHEPIVMILNRTLQSHLHYPVFAILTFAITIAICVLLSRLIGLASPRLLSVLSGGRLR